MKCIKCGAELTIEMFTCGVCFSCGCPIPHAQLDERVEAGFSSSEIFQSEYLKLYGIVYSRRKEKSGKPHKHWLPGLESVIQTLLSWLAFSFPIHDF